MNPPLFVVALAALQDFGLPLLLLVLAWFCWGVVQHLRRRTHRAEVDLERSALLNLPITERREVWIWNPAAGRHELSSLDLTHIDPP